MKSKIVIATQHATQYVAAVFEASLRKAGFVCPNDKLLCWYRIRSAEIVNSVIFCSSWANLPLMIDMYYGIFPSFELPVKINNVVNNVYPEKELFTRQTIVESFSNGNCNVKFSDSILVYAPGGGNKGLYTFEELILPEMDRIETIQQAYDYHKKRRANLIPPAQKMPEMPFGELTKTFINMSLWVNDKEMLRYAVVRANEAVTLFQKLNNKLTKKQNVMQELASWKRIQEVLATGSRDDYVRELVQRMGENIKFLQNEYFTNT